MIINIVKKFYIKFYIKIIFKTQITQSNEFINSHNKILINISFIWKESKEYKFNKFYNKF